MDSKILFVNLFVILSEILFGILFHIIFAIFSTYFSDSFFDLCSGILFCIHSDFQTAKYMIIFILALNLASYFVFSGMY